MSKVLVFVVVATWLYCTFMRKGVRLEEAQQVGIVADVRPGAGRPG